MENVLIKNEIFNKSRFELLDSWVSLWYKLADPTLEFLPKI